MKLVKMNNNLLISLKNNNEDFEWYPTTSEILKEISEDIISLCEYFNNNLSILDIGAGNGSSLLILNNLTSGKNEFEEEGYKLDKKIYLSMYAIEKSKILLTQIPDDIFVIGTDFHEQTFIDKKHDIYFCNPPYSEYDIWTNKLIRESNCQVLYLVIPARWKDNKTIEESLRQREAKVEVLNSFSFLNSEFRKANANVEVVRIKFNRHDRISDRNNYSRVDPFTLWFEDNFKFNTKSKEDELSKKKKEKNNQLVDKRTLIKNLVEYYSEDLNKLIRNYKAVEGLDSEIMYELGLNITGLKDSLYSKIKGLKNIYWKKLFDNLTVITDRLTEKSRKIILDKLTNNTSVDFTEDNISSIVLWTIKNANKYFDKQLLEVYDRLTRPENTINYKSNKRMIQDGWRYNKENHTHYTLDYRIIDMCYNAISSSYDAPNGLKDVAHNRILDIFVIAKNFGYVIAESPLDKQWIAGKKNNFYDENNELFVEIKAHKNGNVHMKFNQKFMKMFNVEAGRLLGWLKSPEEASEETGIDIEEVKHFFKSNLQLIPNDVLLIENNY
jgi:hypothetical protein